VLAEGQRKSGDADHGMPPFCRIRCIRGKADQEFLSGSLFFAFFRGQSVL
jgi:hypothetical protein